MAHPIEGLMESSMKNIKEMVDVNTIIGDPGSDTGRNDDHSGFEGCIRLWRGRFQYSDKGRFGNG